jgi:hypothetical protein
MMMWINILLLNALWFATVVGATHKILWPAYLCLLVLLAVIHIYSGIDKQGWKVIALSLVFGIVIDGFLMSNGMILYNSHTQLIAWLPPLWILALWLGFGASVRVGMQWMLKSPIIGTIFMVVGAPLSYVSAAKLGAIEIPQLNQALAVIAVGWLLYFVCVIQICHSKNRGAEENALV